MQMLYVSIYSQHSRLAPPRELKRTCSKIHISWVQGVPLRLEVGPRDMEEGSAMLVRRDTGKKEPVSWDQLLLRVPQLLEEIQVRVDPHSHQDQG